MQLNLTILMGLFLCDKIKLKKRAMVYPQPFVGIYVITTRVRQFGSKLTPDYLYG